MNAHNNQFREYVEHGWKLCAIPKGTKSPRTTGWNKLANAVTVERAEHLEGAGLLHVYSGTCAIDIDHADLARAWLAERGIDLKALADADDAVQITHGDKTRGKLLYQLSTPLASQKISVDGKTILEFRCADKKGGSVQDVCPPSIHPSGEPYEWAYNNDMADWRSLSPLPKSLHDLWLSMVRKPEPKVAEQIVAGPNLPASAPANLQWVRDLLAGKDPDCDYGTWCDLGMRLHEGTDGGDDGFSLWNNWSAGGSKYPGEETLRAKYETFGRGAGLQATLDGLRQEIVVSDEAFGPPATDPEEQKRINASVKADVAVRAEQRAKAKGERTNRARNLLANPRRNSGKLSFVEYSIDNFLSRLSLLAGSPGIGKTTLLAPLAAGVAHLVRYEGITVTLPRRVIYFAEDPDQVERILYGVQKHVAGAAPIDAFNKWFHVHEASRLSPDDLAALVEIACDEHTRDYKGYAVKPLIVFDTVNTNVELEEENDNDEWGRFLQPLKNALGDTGPCWLVHHLPKTLDGIYDIDKLSARGASAASGGVHNTAFAVQHPSIKNTSFLGTKKVRFEHGGFDMIKFATATDREHVPTPWGESQDVIYRYGTPYRYSRREFAAEIAALKLLDDGSADAKLDNALLAALALQPEWVSGKELSLLVKGNATDKIASRDRLVARGDVKERKREGKPGGGSEYRLANSDERGKLPKSPDPNGDLLGDDNESDGETE